MKSTTLSSLLVIICLSLIFFAPIPTLCSKLYETICSEAKEEANDCLNILKNNSKITSATNYLDISKSILEMAIVKATEAQAFIVEFSNQHATHAIRQCGTAFYTDTIHFFTDSLDEIDRNDFLGANDDAERASSGVSDCDENILKLDKKDYPEIHSLNKGVYLLSEIAYLATKHLIHK
jgi:pectinesterase inhibitor-like protein